MTPMLIDANIYLRFYSQPDETRLIPTLQALAPHIFVSTQIVDEVMRNKLRVAAAFFSEQHAILHSLVGLNTASPSFLDAGPFGAGHLVEEVEALEALRHDVATHRRESEALLDRLETLAEAQLQRVSQSEDALSQALRPLFALAQAPNEVELAKARRRRELGQAPGKRDDPLGDQLTWEQFIAAGNGEPVLWVVTGDHDFFTEFGEASFLNAALLQDRANAGPEGAAVRVFANLPEALLDFTSVHPVPPAVGLLASELRQLAARIRDETALRRLSERLPRREPERRPSDALIVQSAQRVIDRLLARRTR